MVNHDKAICSACGGAVTVRDSRKRQIKDSNGNIYLFRLRRLYCPECKQIHLEIPDIIAPNKHYAADTIQKAITGAIDYCAADNRTIARWKK